MNYELNATFVRSSIATAKLGFITVSFSLFRKNISD